MARRPRPINSFEPNQVSREIIGATLARAQEREIGWLTVLMQEVADVMTSSFFQRMASFMGSEDSMIAPSGVTTTRSFVNGRRIETRTQNFGIDQVLATGPGAQPWKPLSDRYARYKGTEKFWIFKNARNALRQSLKLKKRQRIGSVDRRRPGSRILGSPLKEWTARRNALKVLGGTTVRARSADFFVKPDPTLGLAQNLKPESFVQGGINVGGEETRIRRRIPLTFRFFPNIKDLRIPERVLGTEPSGQDQITKLRGKRRWRRPFMRPLLAYYQQVLIRRAWDDALRATSFTTTQVSTSKTRRGVPVSLAQATKANP